MKLPRLYAIIDRATLDARGIPVAEFARELAGAGVQLVQYRDKVSGPQEVLRAAGSIAQAFAGTDAALVLNDRADLAALLGWGVHVGQEDLTVTDARKVLNCAAVVGISTHTQLQLESAAHSDADYVAIGPVFATGTKADASPVVGLEGVRTARALIHLTKPLVAIGGITLENARSVLDAGADSVAVINGLFVEGMSVDQVARRFLEM